MFLCHFAHTVAPPYVVTIKSDNKAGAKFMNDAVEREMHRIKGEGSSNSAEAKVHRSSCTRDRADVDSPRQLHERRLGARGRSSRATMQAGRVEGGWHQGDSRRLQGNGYRWCAHRG